MSDCYVPRCDEPGWCWLQDLEEPDEVYSVCIEHARVYEQHIRAHNTGPCQFRLGLSMGPRDITPDAPSAVRHPLVRDGIGSGELAGKDALDGS